jgi:hypothetical protein
MKHPSITLVKAVSAVLYLVAAYKAMPVLKILSSPFVGEAFLTLLVLSLPLIPALPYLCVAIILNPVLVSHMKKRQGLQTNPNPKASRAFKIVLGAILIFSSFSLAALGFFSFVMTADAESINFSLLVGGISLLIVLALLIPGIKLIISGIRGGTQQM